MTRTGETDLKKLIKSLKPKHNIGDFVFCEVNDLTKIDAEDIIMFFKEEEAVTIIIKKDLADTLKLPYSFIAAWITLTVYSSLTAVGLTAWVSKTLSDNGISCNVVAAFYHDHIFVGKEDADRAMNLLNQMSS